MKMALRSEYDIVEGVNIELVATRILQNNSSQSKNKSKKGAFMCFVDEHKDRWKKEGKDVSTLTKTIKVGDIEWKKLCAEDRAFYKEQATPKPAVLPVPVIFSETKDDICESNQSGILNSPLSESNQSGIFNSNYSESNPTTILNNHVTTNTKIKQLYIIYEEDEIEISKDCTSDLVMPQNNIPNNHNNENPLHSPYDIKLHPLPPKTARSYVKNLKYPLRRPSNKSLTAKTNLDYSSSEENTISTENNSRENYPSVHSPESSVSYTDLKSSSPIKDKNIESTNCDISPIKAELEPDRYDLTMFSCKLTDWELSSTDQIECIEKIIKQANAILDDSFWDIGNQL